MARSTRFLSGLPQRARGLVERLAGLEAAVLGGVLFVVAGLWVFLGLAAVVRQDDLLELDRAIVRAMRDASDPSLPVGPAWLAIAARDVTALGGTTIITLVTVAVVGFLLLQRRWRMAVFVAVSVTGGGILEKALKALIDRPRPDVVPHLVDVTGQSFPSGHAMLAAVVYPTLGALLSRLADNRRTKLYLLGVALTLTFLIGLTRVYLGVHYPTDLLGGWVMGLVWAVLCGLAARFLQPLARARAPR